MPVVSRETVSVNSKPFVKITVYSVKNKLFSIKLPSWIAEATRTEDAYGNTQDSLETNFRKICKDYDESQRKVTKVIAYLIEINRYQDASKKDITFCNCDNALGFEYKVLFEKELDGRKKYYTENDRREDLSNHTIIPWTEDAEAFFARTDAALIELIDKVGDFFKDKEKLQLFIADRKPLLLSNK